MTTTGGIFLLGLLACSGCATMFQGSSQKIPVASTPAGAAVTVNGQPMGVTPLFLDLKRKEHATLTIPGRKGTILTQRSFNGNEAVGFGGMC